MMSSVMIENGMIAGIVNGMISDRNTMTESGAVTGNDATMMTANIASHIEDVVMMIGTVIGIEIGIENAMMTGNAGITMTGGGVTVLVGDTHVHIGAPVHVDDHVRVGGGLTMMMAAGGVMKRGNEMTMTVGIDVMIEVIVMKRA